MKIGFVIDDTLDTSDGVQQYVLLVSQWLKNHGHDIHYLVGQTKRTDISNIHSLAWNVRVGFNKNKLSVPLPANRDQIKELLSNEEFDVLHVQMPFSPFLAGKIISSAPHKTAIIATFHIAPHSKLVQQSTRALALTQKNSTSRINAFISVSKVAKDFAKATYKINSKVIPNAVNLMLWKPVKTKRQKNQIAFVGRLVKRKGPIYLLKAFVELVKNGDTTANLIIAGDGPDRAKLEGFVLKHNLYDRVTFLGFISEDQKRKLLHESMIAVYPSTGGESFGIVLIEAMAAGTLALGGNNPGYASVLKDAPESLFDPKDTKELSQKIHTLLTNPESYQKLHAKQQITVSQFDIEKVGNDIIDSYKSAIKQQKEPYG